MKFMRSFLIGCSVISLMSTPLQAMMEGEEEAPVFSKESFLTKVATSKKKKSISRNTAAHWKTLCAKNPEEALAAWNELKPHLRTDLFLDYSEKPMQALLWDRGAPREDNDEEFWTGLLRW